MKQLSSAMRHRNEARHRGSGRCWSTPPELFAEINAEFNFTLDPCATAKSAKCADFFTEEQNGLNQNWGGVVFMNPPYGKEIRSWIYKARVSAAAGALVVGLIPAATDQDWWHDHIVGVAEVRYLRGRPRFLVYEDDGSTKWASPFQPVLIVIWRPGVPMPSKLSQGRLL